MNHSETTIQNYDELPYEGHAFAQTHPGLMATVARIFGLEAPPVEQARILELGCGRGENLIAMAYELPDAHLVGTDLSPRQIAMGTDMIRQLGLNNIQLLVRDIMASAPRETQFDYIICHGVYSWVPPQVQDKILETCRNLLSPHGVAVISYNVYPGWHQRGALREMLLYHVGPHGTPQERVAKARAFLEFLAHANLVPNTPYAQVLTENAQWLKKEGDSYIFHEFLEEINQPFYFHEFAQRVAQTQLAYLGDSIFNSSLPQQLPDPVSAALQPFTSDVVAWEQHLDFLRNRMFRSSLLVHAGRQIKREPQLDALLKMHVAVSVRPVSPQPEVLSEAAESFEKGNGFRVSTNVPVMKYALCHLSSIYPSGMLFEELWEQIRQKIGSQLSGQHRVFLEDWRNLAQFFIQAIWSELIEIRSYQPRLCDRITAYPQVSALARCQAEHSLVVTNLLHRSVGVDAQMKLLFLSIDGQRDRDSLIALLRQAIADGKVTVEKPAPAQDAPTDSPPEDLVPAIVDNVLEIMRRSALLIA